MPSSLLSGVGLSVAMIKIDTRHARSTDVLSGGAKTTGTLGGDGSAPGSTVSMVDSTLTIVTDGVTVGIVGRRSREGKVDFPQSSV